VNVARACRRIYHQEDDRLILEIVLTEAFVGSKVPSFLEESGHVVIGGHALFAESSGLVNSYGLEETFNTFLVTECNVSIGGLAAGHRYRGRCIFEGCE
jgi:hypothetical protein